MNDDEQEVQNGSEVTSDPETTPEEPSHRARRRSQPVKDETVQVTILHTDTWDGLFIVLDILSGNVYLVPTYELQYTVKPQEIKKSILDVAQRLYDDFDEDLQSLHVDPRRAKIALGREGIIRKEGVNLPDVLLRRGIKEQI